MTFQLQFGFLFVLPVAYLPLLRMAASSSGHAGLAGWFALGLSAAMCGGWWWFHRDNDGKRPLPLPGGDCGAAAVAHGTCSNILTRPAGNGQTTPDLATRAKQLLQRCRHLPRPLVWLVTGLTLLVAAVAIGSPALAAIAVIVASVEILRRVTTHTRRSARTIRLVLLLLFLLPVGLMWDGRFVAWLVQTSSRAGSLVLDFLGCDHVLAGDVLRVPSRQWAVNAMISDISTPFTLVAAAAMLAVRLRRPLAHALLMLVAGGFWTGMGNVLCMTCVVAAHAWHGWDLSAGWGRAVLGVGWFGVGLWMLFCTDRLLVSVLAPIPVDAESREADYHRQWS
jgi:hypothetical protein